MTTSDWIALAGLLLAAVGSAGAVWAHLTSKMSGNTRTLHGRIEETQKRIAEAEGQLHNRINKVERDYVRRDDLRDDMQRIERGQESMAGKLDQVILTIVPAITKMAEVSVRKD
jgi:hypothetical protein